MAEATIVALYDHYDNAGAAVGDIIQAGVARDKISLLANNLNGDHPPLTTNPSYAREEIDTKEEAQPGVVTGAEFGIGVGGILGVLLGTGAIVIPGIGPLIAAGTLATVAAGAGAGLVVGGIIGMFTSHGISDKDAHLYAEGLKRGGTLVTVVADSDKIDAIREIFKTYGAVDIEKREATWTAEGWVSFDPQREQLTQAELAAIRSDMPGDEVEHHHAVRHYFSPRNGSSEVPDGASNSQTHYAEDQLRQ